MSSRTIISAKNLKIELHRAGDPERAKFSLRFFKTGPGEYAEGDQFLGLTVPFQRQIAKKFKTLSLEEIEQLLTSKIHEERLTALFILRDQFKVTKTKRKKIIALYLKQKKYVNNWDLVDSSAEMLGEFVEETNDYQTLENLIHSKNIWDRRIAMIATFYFLKKKNPKLTLSFAKVLLNDEEPLLQKASGWMLREMGKRCGEKYLLKFLDEHATDMPTTMFSYSTERLTIGKRKKYQQMRRDKRKK